MNDKLKEICDKYNETYCFMFGSGGLLEGTFTTEDAKTSCVATILIQYEKIGGFHQGSSGGAPTGTGNQTPISGEKCPKCGGGIKTGVSKSTGKSWKRCDACSVWISDDGKTIPMRDR